NIPADTTELKLDAGNPKAGLLPKGALQTRTDFGAAGYGGSVRLRGPTHLPADTTELKLDAGNPKAGLLPKGALQTRTDFGAPGYGGPCPPEGHGPHRYIFTVFAVKQDALQVNADTSAAISAS